MSQDRQRTHLPEEEQVRQPYRRRISFDLSRIPAWGWILLGSFFVTGLGVIDFLTGSEISSALFYLFPIALVTWYAGRGPGLLMVVLSGLTWYFAEISLGVSHSSPLVLYWNTLIRLGFFASTMWLLAILRSADERLQRQVKLRTAELESEILERRQAEQKLKEQAALLDIARDAIMVRDLNNNILYWNRGAEQVYGWTEQEAVGRNALELLLRGNSTRIGEIIQTVLKDGHWEGELPHVTKDGRAIVVDARLSLMRDDEGKPHSILFTNRDITEKKLLEAQVLRMQRLESIGTLAGGIAHDLNNVLGPILLSIQILRESVSDPKGQRYLELINSTAERGANIVKQLLTFARGVEGERISVQPRHLLKEIATIVQETFPRSIEVSTDFPTDLWTVSADPTQLHQVLMNICVNARDAMPAGGKLLLAAEDVSVKTAYAEKHFEVKSGRYVHIRIVDTGVGIPQQFLGKIFEPFFTTKDVGKGTGLGLSTAHSIVKAHAGFINVYSEVGRGTEFKIYLPAETGVEAQQEDAGPPVLPMGAGELILVADDEASLREISKYTLESFGYTVLTAADGVEALSLYEKRRDEIAAVLLDMIMPVMDGEATIRALVSVDPAVKVIATSGLTTDKERLSPLLEGHRAFLAKPFTAEKLLQTLADLLGKKSEPGDTAAS